MLEEDRSKLVGTVKGDGLLIWYHVEISIRNSGHEREREREREKGKGR